MMNASQMIHGDRHGQSTANLPLKGNSEIPSRGYESTASVNNLKYEPGIPQLGKDYKSLSLVPTTDQGRNHQIVDHDIKQRESTKYGYAQKELEAMMMPKLNDVNYHKTSSRVRSNFNLITGTYKRP